MKKISMKNVAHQSSFSNRTSNFIVAGIILAGLVLAIASFWNDSIIIDEDPHIGAGYSYLVKQDMRLNPEHPPLAKDLAALPLLFLNLNQTVFDSSYWLTDVNGQWNFGRELIFHSDVDAQLITRMAKFPMLLFYILSAILIFKWTKERYSQKAGFIALILFAFSPTVMAHSRFVTTDMPALFGVLVASYFFVRYLKDNSRKNFWFAALTFGIALLLKFSTILLVPFFVVLAIIWGAKSLWRTILVMIVGFVIIAWPVYYFHTLHYPPARQHSDTQELLGAFENRTLADPVVWASDKPVIRAAAHYSLGLLMVVQRSAGGNTVYYNGEVLKSAGPGYFPFVYAIKETLPWLILLFGAIVIAISKIRLKKPNIKNNFDEIAMLVWLLIYWGTSMHSTLNIGVRHLLPVFPFMIILVAGQLAKPKFWVLSFGIWILLGWHIVESIRIFPHYLSYFNQLVGGPSQGYKHVVDSNLDWGQDIKRLADWVEENDIQKIQLDYFGWADQSYYLGDKFIWITTKQKPQPGYFAISVTYLQNNIDTNYAWLKDKTPITVIGNSIFVYYLSL